MNRSSYKRPANSMPVSTTRRTTIDFSGFPRQTMLRTLTKSQMEKFKTLLKDPERTKEVNKLLVIQIKMDSAYHKGRIHEAEELKQQLQKLIKQMGL